jgi:hypothetical protein
MVKLSELKAAKRDGVAAHAAAVIRDANPFPRGSPQQAAWWEGWDREASQAAKPEAPQGAKAKWFQQHFR